MLRIRIFRILLPLVFLAVIALLIWAIRPIPVATRPVIPSNEPIESGVDKVGVKVFGLGTDGALRKTLDVVSGSFKECGENCLEALDIEQFEIARADAEALVVMRATSSKVIGVEGEREMSFTGPVLLYDPDLAIQIEMPALDVDEAAGIARSDGAVRIANDDQVTDAASLTYGLNGQPTRLERLELQDQNGGLLVARTALLHDGFSDIEFLLGVRYKRAEDERFWAETARIRRDESGTTRSIVASGHFSAAMRAPDGSLFEISSDSVDASWAEDGQLERLLLDGDALAERGQERLSAERLALNYDFETQRWAVLASDTVRAVIAFGNDRQFGRLRSNTLMATLDQDFLMLDAAAEGDVEFRAPDLLAEAQTARLVAPEEAPQLGKLIELLSGEGRRARLAQGDTRVVAERILTDSAGSSMDAQGRVESTLLSIDRDGGAEDGLFKVGEAIHFISGRLVGSESASTLTFSEGVRAWQGDQNLSAQEVTLSQSDGNLQATTGVTTRFPRQTAAPATSAQAFVQISSESLSYDRSLNQALYEGAVRTVLDEGWIESERLRVVQSAEGADEDLQELQAEGTIQLEFVDEGSRTQGRSDRLVYLPARDTLWLHGDERPAEVQRSGKADGTTRGRVLRYRIDDGSLFVESGRIIATPQAEPTETPEAKDPEESP